VADAGAALLALLVATTLSVYKPRGMTRYGWRKQHEQRGWPALTGRRRARTHWIDGRDAPSRLHYLAGVGHNAAQLWLAHGMEQQGWGGGLMRAFSKVRRLFLVVVAILATPGLGLAQAQRSHCAGHATSAMHAGEPAIGHGQDHSSTASWTRPSHSDCPHCPATTCASVAPCSVSGSSVAAPTVLTISSLPTHHWRTARTQVSLHSRTYQPPTPPPQSIA
jgi:hypothetical protein